MIAINCPLLILTDSPEFPRKLTVAGMVKMCGNEAKVTNRRFDGNWGNLYARDLPHSNIFFVVLNVGDVYCSIKLLSYTFSLKLLIGFTYNVENVIQIRCNIHLL